jgi:two-component system response regulator AtoC
MNSAAGAAHAPGRIPMPAIRAGAREHVANARDVDRVLGRRVVAGSLPMKRLLSTVDRIAPRDITVLVRGETGTGKELVASLLHAGSRRADRPLIRFNCAAIPVELAEAELFGHARGAFTGATHARPGFFKRAHGGTLVLDEVGELPVGVQAKLLRVLQDGEIQPVGTGTVERVDVRVIASTNRDLESEARAGRFREDLYYRLAVVEVVVPPLRERRGDIPDLVAEFVRRYGDRFDCRDVRFAPELVEKLSNAEWPGNVRQLESCVARLVAMAGDGAEIGPEAFDASAAASPPPPEAAEGSSRTAAPDAAATESLSLREQVEAVERTIVAQMLTATDGNQSEAARRLGISRTALIDKMKKYGVG